MPSAASLCLCRTRAHIGLGRWHTVMPCGCRVCHAASQRPARDAICRAMVAVCRSVDSRRRTTHTRCHATRLVARQLAAVPVACSMPPRATWCHLVPLRRGLQPHHECHTMLQPSAMALALVCRALLGASQHQHRTDLICACLCLGHQCHTQWCIPVHERT